MAFTFAEKMERSKGNLMIVDALNLGFRWMHSGKTKFVDEYLATVASIANSYECAQIVIAADHGSSTFRKALSPAYKQNRKDKYEAQSEADKAKFAAFFEEYERTLTALEERYTVFRFKGVEADDIAAYIVQNRLKYGIDQIWLISSDKDWDLLIDPNVSRFSYVTRKEITANNWHEHYEVEMDDYISFKCLVGDAGDGIEGIPSIGPKRAADLIKQYGSALDIYDLVPLPGKYKYIEQLNKHADRILLNYELMDLRTYCEEAIGAENVATINARMLRED